MRQSFLSCCKLSIVLFLTFFSISYSFTQCPTGNFLLLDTQDKVDQFANLYPNCTNLPNGLVINGSDITDLSGLSQLESVGTFLRILALTQLTNLNGLHNIESVGGELIINANHQLVDLNELSSLNAVGTPIEIRNNPSMTSLTGLTGLTSAHQILISNNDALLNLTGLESLNSVFSLYIDNNNIIENFVGLDNLSSLSHLTVDFNKGLTEFEGLNNLQTLDGTLKIKSNNLLTSITNLEDVDLLSISNIEITGNDILSECAIFSICNYLANDNTIDVGFNNTGCSNQQEIEDACALLCSAGDPCDDNDPCTINDQTDSD